MSNSAVLDYAQSLPNGAVQSATQQFAQSMRGLTSEVPRTSQWFATSGQQAGLKALDSAADALQSQSLSALSRISDFTSSHVSALSRWFTGGLSGALGSLLSGVHGLLGHSSLSALRLPSLALRAPGGGVGLLRRGVGGLAGFGGVVWQGIGGALNFGLHNSYSVEAQRYRNRDNGQFASFW